MDNWIPCKNGLPVECGLYLVTTKAGRIKMDRFYPDANIWGINTRNGYEHAMYKAWMPLPRPWEGADDDL